MRCPAQACALPFNLSYPNHAQPQPTNPRVQTAMRNLLTHSRGLRTHGVLGAPASTQKRLEAVSRPLTHRTHVFKAHLTSHPTNSWQPLSCPTTHTHRPRCDLHSASSRGGLPPARKHPMPNRHGRFGSMGTTLVLITLGPKQKREGQRVRRPSSDTGTSRPEGKLYFPLLRV